MDLKYQVTVSKTARKDLKSIVEYVAQRVSYDAANRMRQALILAADGLAQFPRRFSTEPLVNHLNKEIRSFSKWNVKIVYQIDGSEVRILSFFSTFQNPDKLHELIE